MIMTLLLHALICIIPFSLSASQHSSQRAKCYGGLSIPYRSTASRLHSSMNIDEEKGLLEKTHVYLYSPNNEQGRHIATFPRSPSPERYDINISHHQTVEVFSRPDSPNMIEIVSASKCLKVLCCCCVPAVFGSGVTALIMMRYVCGS